MQRTNEIMATTRGSSTKANNGRGNERTPKHKTRKQPTPPQSSDEESTSSECMRELKRLRNQNELLLQQLQDQDVTKRRKTRESEGTLKFAGPSKKDLEGDTLANHLVKISKDILWQVTKFVSTEEAVFKVFKYCQGSRGKEGVPSGVVPQIQWCDPYYDQ